MARTPPPRRGKIIVLVLVGLGVAIGLVGGALAARWKVEQSASATRTVEQAAGRAVGAAPPPLIDLNVSDAGLPTAEPAALARGAAIYARRCASCHGPRGEGEPNWQVERADGTLPAPPHDASGHTWHHSDAELDRIIREGGTVYMPNSRMPAFGGELSQTEAQAVLAYIKARFWGPRERVYQAEVSRQWDEALRRAGPTDLPMAAQTSGPTVVTPEE